MTTTTSPTGYRIITADEAQSRYAVLQSLTTLPESFFTRPLLETADLRYTELDDSTTTRVHATYAALRQD